MLKGRTPTAAEKRWLDRIMQDDIGCIVCRLYLRVYTPPEPHHIEGKTKPGAHAMAIPLCPPHHRWHLKNDQCVSVHPHKAEFERRYGSERKLLEATRELVRDLS